MPIVIKGTELSGGVVVAICRGHVVVKRSVGDSFVLKKISHREVESLVGLV